MSAFSEGLEKFLNPPHVASTVTETNNGIMDTARTMEKKNIHKR